MLQRCGVPWPHNCSVTYTPTSPHTEVNTVGIPTLEHAGEACCEVIDGGGHDISDLV